MPAFLSPFISAAGMSSISQRTFDLAKYTFHKLSAFRHSNGCVVAEIYCQSGFADIALQGGIVTFNLRRPNGDYVGFTEVYIHLAIIKRLFLFLVVVGAMPVTTGYIFNATLNFHLLDEMEHCMSAK